VFRRLLVANRGEIALRIVRTCRELGIATAVVASAADQDSAAAQLADEVIVLGDPWCYLDAERIVAAAKRWGAEAVHPGYGFLAENAAFARLCAEAGLVFIGPPPDVMAHLGEKDRARASAAALGIPCLPGTPEAVGAGGAVDVDAVAAMAARIGYPVLIKAAAGGGGRGMRLARDEEELRAQLPRAMSEANAAFKSPAVYLEKFLPGARHVEIQVLADAHGHIVHLGERDCTVQRRHQKLIEEAPSPVVDATLRAAMGAAAAKLLASLGYVNAGTVEFLVDEAGRFYFLEVNTRIQVEHPVTEVLYGVDIVAEQIRIAAGLPLSWRQEDLVPRGWAIECRINAEDPARNFSPSPGRIDVYRPPGGPGVRVDGAAFPGWVIPPYYDSLIAKLIAWADGREQAIARMRRALLEFVVHGVPTTIPFHLAVLEHEAFRSGRFDTGIAEQHVPLERVQYYAAALARQRPGGAEVAVQPGDRALAPAQRGPAGRDTETAAAVAAALAAVLDEPHQIVSISPAPPPHPAGLWGFAGRLAAMQNRSLTFSPRGDRRTHA